LRARAKLAIVEEQRFRAQRNAALEGTGIRGLLVPHDLEVSAWAPPESSPLTDVQTAISGR
jgi:hypothetical protein